MYEIGLIPGCLDFILLAALGTGLLLLSPRHRSEWRWQIGLFLAAYTIRYALSIVIYQYGLVSVLGDEDASGWVAGVTVSEIWHEQGLSVLEIPFAWLQMILNQHPGPFFLRTTHRSYFYFLGTLFYLTDSPGRLPAAALNGFFGALTTVFGYRIARALFSPWVAKRVGIWICVLPSMIVWSAMTVKEPLVICFEELALYGCIRLSQNRFSLKYLTLVVATIVMLLPLRFYAAYITGVGAVLAVLLPVVVNHRNRALSYGLALTVVPLLVLGTGLFAYRQVYQDKFDVERINSFRLGVSIGGERSGAASGVVNDFDITTPDGLIMSILFGGSHLMLAPFPWQLGNASLRMVLTLPELVFWWYLFFFAVVPGGYYCLTRRLSDTWIIFLFVLAFSLLYSVMFANIGLVFRQRAQLFPFLFLFAGVGLERRHLARLARRQAAAIRPNRSRRVQRVS